MGGVPGCDPARRPFFFPSTIVRTPHNFRWGWSSYIAMISTDEPIGRAFESQRRGTAAFLPSFLALLGSMVLTTACGSSSDLSFDTPYTPGSKTVVGKEPEPEPTPFAGCTDTTCKAADERCGANGAADVIVDSSGKVVDVICYGQDVSVDHVPVDSVPSYTSPGNNAVIVIDGAADGTDVMGDVSLTGNNAIVYGAGPDQSVIGGTVDVEKNNAKIRGVRILGDVTIDKNDTKLLFCVIEGNLTITGNNTTLAECDVYGTVTITGNNTVLVKDRFGGTHELSAKNLTCSDVTRFDDANANYVVEDAEVQGPVDCGDADKVK